MSKQIDIFIKGNEHIGRLVFDGSQVHVLTPKSLNSSTRRDLMSFVRECVENGADMRWGKKVGDCYVDGIRRVKANEPEFSDAVRDSINDGLELNGKRAFAVPAKAL